jgi:uncharacterized iron-regulated protein
MRQFIKKRYAKRNGRCTLSRLYLLQILAWSLGIVWLCTFPVYAQKVMSFYSQVVVFGQVGVDVRNSDRTREDPRNLVNRPEVILPELAQADVVYLGETHDNPEDHQTQLEIIQKLQQRNPKIAIALEMFQRPYQNVLDRYLAGQVSEQELLEQSEYNQRWGFPWRYYGPILRFAKEKQLPVIALNTPTEVTRKVAREGLESLTTKQRQFIPPFSEIRTDNAEYRQLIVKAFQRHQAAAHGSSADESRFFLAQVLWDETMAEEIAKSLKANPDYQVVVLAGQGHIIYGYGIPSRVARRLNDKQLVQRSVLLSPPKEAPVDTDKPIADFVWQHQ